MDERPIRKACSVLITFGISVLRKETINSKLQFKESHSTREKRKLLNGLIFQFPLIDPEIKDAWRYAQLLDIDFAASATNMHDDEKEVLIMKLNATKIHIKKGALKALQDLFIYLSGYK